jgi:hypothetical protein
MGLNEENERPFFFFRLIFFFHSPNFLSLCFFLPSNKRREQTPILHNKRPNQLLTVLCSERQNDERIKERK